MFLTVIIIYLYNLFIINVLCCIVNFRVHILFANGSFSHACSAQDFEGSLLACAGRLPVLLTTCFQARMGS